jgi:Fe2+ transport system protein FeoA
MELTQLKLLDSFELKSINKIDLQMRLQDMGFVEGVKCQKIRELPFGGPIVICVGDSLLAIRKEDAQCIQVSVL